MNKPECNKQIEQTIPNQQQLSIKKREKEYVCFEPLLL